MTTASSIVPQVALARVLSSGGPYRENEILSVAFVDASLARLAPHREGDGEGFDRAEARTPKGAPRTVPETIVVEVLTDAEPHAKHDRLVLSFVDPQVARVVSGVMTPLPILRQALDLQPRRQDVVAPIVETVPTARAVLLFERWNEHEARRFIAVVDKLFTVERLGWYRHALAMRLLLPDTIVLGGSARSLEAISHLDLLRAAANEALNAPLLAAFMPHFNLDAAWLASIETPALLGAAAALREIVDRQHGVGVDAPHAMPDLIGGIAHEEWTRWGGADTEAFLALLFPSGGRHPGVAQRLSDYRTALLELFGQMAQAPGPVRSNQMAQSNPLLDDRLWNLAGAFQDAWGVNSVV